MKEKNDRLKGLAQRLYITWDTFMANDLFTYASAGAYSFLLSALPVLLMVLVILLRLLDTSPEVIRDLLGSSKLFTESLDISSFLDSVMSIKSVGIFEAIIGISIFWMARRFFASIQHGMKIIYRKRGKGKPIKENLVVLAGEAILIILIVAATIFLIAGNAFFNSELSENLFSPFFFSLLKNIFRYAPFAIILVFLFLVYLYSPRTRPGVKQSLGAAVACSVSFAVVQLVFTSIVNMSRYNLVYGILSNVIVLLLEVYLFFFLFLFYAQFLYVIQFFDSFLLARIYLLPVYDDPGLLRQLERMLFVKPTLFFRQYAIRIKAGETVFRIGEDSTEIYYIWHGSIALNMPNQVISAGCGRIFGEFSGMIGASRTATAVAVTDSILLRIPGRIFQETIEVDGSMSRRTLLMIADYVRKKNAAPLSTDSQV